MPRTEVMVSVFCIAFNHREYISRCLDSMIAQKTDFSYEIIVHDDASTDGTREIIEQYAGKYPDLIVPILQETNKYSTGHDILREYLFPAASGKYIVECEGDDYWCDPLKLKTQVEMLESHPECALCVHETDTVDKDGNPQDLHFPMIELDHNIITTKEFMDLTLDQMHWLFHLSAFMVSSQLFKEYMDFKKTGFPSKFYRVGDLPLYLYFALKGNLCYINRVMSVYTMESGGFMSRVQRDEEFAYKVHKGYLEGLTAFDAYSGYKYSKGVRKALAIRRFEIARHERRFDDLVSDPELRPLLRTRNFTKRTAICIVGYSMLALRGKQFEKRKERA